MRPRFFPLALALSVLLALPAAAFSDVPANTWYASSAAQCQQAGLLKGTSSDTFSPDKTVTLAEVMTVAARLSYQQSGGNGDLPTAPESWGTGSINTPAGAVLLSFSSEDLDHKLSYYFDSTTPRRLHLLLEVNSQEYKALSPAGGAAEVSLTLNGAIVLTGFLAPASDGTLRIEFTAAVGLDYTAFHRELSSFLPAPARGLWYRNALWYAREHGLMDAQPMETPFEAPASREELGEWILSALPADCFPAITTLDSLPDTEDPGVLTLYRAGIFTGVDAQGTFAGNRTLTRAELAAVLARVLDPQQRVSLNSRD